ncbi:MAG: sulfite exporter TauE/SafE family protein [Candidatus Kapaibacterium sp.]
MDVLPAILLGFFGSLHCVGMCGAIALTLATPATNAKYIIGRLLYNIGRVTTYTFLGVLFGSIGTVANVAGIQQWLSISIGVAILIYLLLPRTYKNSVVSIPIVTTLVSRIKSGIAPLLSNSRYGMQYAIGLLNGFLPCGFVYMGLAGALQQTTVTQGALFMMFFGLGTIPAMLTLSFSQRFFSFQKQLHIRKLIPIGAALMAVLFILRGLALGIPYISPILPANVEVLSDIKQDGHCVPSQK